MRPTHCIEVKWTLLGDESLIMSLSSMSSEKAENLDISEMIDSFLTREPCLLIFYATF